MTQLVIQMLAPSQALPVYLARPAILDGHLSTPLEIAFMPEVPDAFLPLIGVLSQISAPRVKNWTSKL